MCVCVSERGRPPNDWTAVHHDNLTSNMHIQSKETYYNVMSVCLCVKPETWEKTLPSSDWQPPFLLLQQHRYQWSLDNNHTVTQTCTHMANTQPENDSTPPVFPVGFKPKSCLLQSWNVFDHSDSEVKSKATLKHTYVHTRTKNRILRLTGGLNP